MPLPPPDCKIDFSICSLCYDHGGISSDSKGWFRAYECDCCGRKGKKSRVAELNKRERERQKGANFDRIQWSIHERAFYEQWAEENRAIYFVNHGLSALQCLLSKAASSGLHLKDVKFPKEEAVTDRDYLVAATIIQWLGTNVGRCFLEEVNKRIEEYKKNPPKDMKSLT